MHLQECRASQLDAKTSEPMAALQRMLIGVDDPLCQAMTRVRYKIHSIFITAQIVPKMSPKVIPRIDSSVVCIFARFQPRTNL